MSTKNIKFKEQKIESISSEWVVLNFKDVCTLQRGFDLPVQKRFSGRYPLVSSNGISDYISEYKVDAPGVVTGRSGTLGNSFFVKNNFWPLNTSLWVKDFKGNNPYFIYLILSLLNLGDFNGGSGVPTLNRNHLDLVKVKLPSLDEQQKIAEILSSLDDKIELNRKINDNLEKIARSLFKRWFVDFEFPNKDGKPYKSSGGKMVDSELGDIPDNFVVDVIGNKLKTVLGGTPSRANSDYWQNGSIPWINSGAINNFPVLEQSEFITMSALKNSAAKLMPIKTVILPFVISVGKPVKISILGIESSGNQSVLGVLANEALSSEYIYYWINSIKDKIYSCATGGAQQHINKSNVDESYIIVPTEKTLGGFNKIAKSIFDSIILNAYASLQLSKLRDSLLPKLMNGKIRV